MNSCNFVYIEILIPFHKQNKQNCLTRAGRWLAHDVNEYLLAACRAYTYQIPGGGCALDLTELTALTPWIEYVQDPYAATNHTPI
jgi:hypothetical protein